MLLLLPILLYTLPILSLSLPTCQRSPSTDPSNIPDTNPIFPGLPEYQCVDLPSWSANRFNNAPACRDAFNYAKEIESSRSREKFEFLPNNQRPSTRRYARMDTPRRYTKRGCTVAIAMLDHFPLDLLPGQRRDRYRWSHDVLSFEEVWRKGQFVWECCVQYGRPGPQPGWNNAGPKKSVGIFFWAENSEMDIRISGGPWFRGDGGDGQGRNNDTERGMEGTDVQ
ncbi:MAG: hypothetical protein Q9219_003584 [cf. Caloplaca sp. 3 TL-2023]